MSATLKVHDQVIQELRFQIAKLRKKAYGKSAEESGLAINEEDEVVAVATSSVPQKEKVVRRRPRVSDKAVQERRELDPGCVCPDCGGELRLVGEDVSKILDMIAAQMKVISVARLKKSCRCCEKMVQPPAPSRPIPGSMAGPGLLSYILVSKFDDHLPLYRLNEIFARMGADIPDSTLVEWCGRAMKVLQPLIERIEASVMSCDLLHADDTPIRVLDRLKGAKGLGKGVKQGRIWTYVRDQRPCAGSAPPGAVYYYAPDWKQEHVQHHLRNTSGILQADGYKGYKQLYEPDKDGNSRFQEASCWAHWRRDFHDIWESGKSEIALEALQRIGKLYDIEQEINGKSPEIRLATRQKRSKPIVEALREWAEKQLTRIPGKGALATAFRYGLSRWPSFTLFLEEARVAIDNNAAERALRPIGLGRKNWLFAGSDTGAETLARAMTIIETAKFNGLDPQAYLADVLNRIHDHKINQLDKLLPWHWSPATITCSETA